ncbi:hypothetical protein K2X30_13180 [bacterium]|nr:hypothetical protein [bacterium]
MGKRRPNAFHSFSMLTEVHRQTPDPDASGVFQTLKAPFGEILVLGARLDPAETYSKIVAHSDGQNHFQGDIIEIDLSGDGKQIPKHRFSMLLSHSCDVGKLTHLLVAPAYLHSELDDSAVLTLRPGTKDSKKMRGNWFANEVIPYVGLPATDITGKPGGEQILVCLHLGVPIPKNVVTTRPPQLRLKYRASSYLQGRLAALLMRDVQRSDETREM